MERYLLRSREQWRAFDFWAGVIAILFALLLILLWLMGSGPREEGCCEFKGRTDLVESIAKSEAIDTDKVSGTPKVTEAIEPTPPKVGTAPYFVSVKSNGARVMLSGSVADAASRDTIIEQLQREYGANNVESSLSVDANLAPLDLASFTPVLGGVKALRNWLVTLSPTQLLISGDTSDANTAALIADIGANATSGKQGQNSAITFVNQTEIVEPGTSDLADSANDEPLDCELALAESRVEFALNSAELTRAGQRSLQNVLFCLRNNAYEVVGHTDSDGDLALNARLSLARAVAVRDYLVSVGVDASKLSVSGAGEAEPIADNSTAEGRKRNRRIEFRTR